MALIRLAIGLSQNLAALWMPLTELLAFTHIPRLGPIGNKYKRAPTFVSVYLLPKQLGKGKIIV